MECRLVNGYQIVVLKVVTISKDQGFCSYVFVSQMYLSAGASLGGSGSRRKLSFKNVSNVVVQLLHSIKFNVDVPFSNMAASPQELKANAARKVCHKSIQQAPTMPLFYANSGRLLSTILFAWKKLLHLKDRFLPELSFTTIITQDLQFRFALSLPVSRILICWEDIYNFVVVIWIWYWGLFWKEIQ